MSQMKTLAIEQMNLQCNAYDKFIEQVNESGLPLWMIGEYDNYNNLLQEQEEVESPILKNIMMSYLNFIHSEEGERYHELYGNWDDAYQQYREHSINPV